MSILILQSRTEKKTTEWVLEPTNLPWVRPELTLHLSSDLSQYSGAWQTLNQFPNQCQFTHSESLDSKGDQIPCIINANMHYKSFKQPSSIRLVSYTRVTALMIRKCPGLPWLLSFSHTASTPMQSVSKSWCLYIQNISKYNHLWPLYYCHPDLNLHNLSHGIFD